MNVDLRLLDVRCQITDGAVLDRISRDAILGYLTGANWSKWRQYDDGSEHWTKLRIAANGMSRRFYVTVPGALTKDRIGLLGEAIDDIGEADRIPALRLLVRLVPDLISSQIAAAPLSDACA